MKKMKNKIIIIYLIITLLISINVLIGCIESPSDQTVIIKGKGRRYSTIMDAIHDAENGDTIIAGKGIYNESLVIDKSISLIGKGKNLTIINGNLTGDVIYISANHVTITGFTIQNSGNQRNYRHSHRGRYTLRSTAENQRTKRILF